MNILRDSDVLVSLVLREVPSSDCNRDETLFTESVGGSPVNGVPVCSVYLVTGYVKLAVLDRLPTSGVSFLSGNYLAEDRMRPCPLVSHHPSSENNNTELEAEYPSLFPACVVTRSVSIRCRAGKHLEASAPVNVPYPEAISTKEISLRLSNPVGQEFRETERIFSNKECPIIRS